MAEGFRLLLVEDSPSDAALVADQVRLQTRWDLAVATTHAEAVQRLSAGSFDAVLLDLGLPDADGLETVRDLSERFDVPIIVLTRRAESTWGSEVLRSGAQDFISKEDLAGTTLPRVLRYAHQRHAHRQQLERAQRRLQRYAQAVAQDVLNPLNAIRGVGELIKLEEQANQRSGSPVDGYADQIVALSVRLRDLVAGLLEDALSDGEVAVVDMHAAARWAEDLLADRLNQSGAQMTITRLPRLRGDRMVLRQIVLNLTSNALEHATADPLQVRWSSWRRDDGGWDLVLRDNGTTVDPELIRIGQPLVAEPIDPITDGPGIGLRAAASGMADHDGHLWLSRGPMGGLCVTLAFPPSVSVDDD